MKSSHRLLTTIIIFFLSLPKYEPTFNENAMVDAFRKPDVLLPIFIFRIKLTKKEGKKSRAGVKKDMKP